ncbi:MAG: hypothetical protein Q9165_001960 [Trypethelium subeluteriae]
MVACGFGALLPALVFRLNIFARYPIGNLPTGQYVGNGNDVGTLTSVPGYNVSVNASLNHLDDFTTIAPGGPYRMDIRGLLETDDGEYIGVSAIGFIANTTRVADILGNQSGTTATQWGELDTITTWSFLANEDSKYKDLGDSTWVSNIRMYPSNNKDTLLYIDFKLSKVLAGPLCSD